MLVLLDLDGTLTDPYDGITRSVTHALARLGRPLPPPEELRAFIGPPLQDSFARLGLDDPDVEHAIAVYRERFTDMGLYENRIYEGVPDALARLRAADLRLAVATSKPTPFAERIVTHFGLDAHIELVVGATLDGSRRTKTDIIRVALAALDVDAQQAVMVGDRSQDVVGAHANALPCIGGSWGYANDGELEGAGADALVDTPSELVEHLLARRTLRT